MSALPLPRRAVDHPGLFMIRLERPSAIPAASKTLEPLVQKKAGRGRVAPTARQKSGLHRYCSGCAHETEHVAWAADGLASIPSIRWPAAEPARGTTTCLSCGQWRAASSQPGPSAWSSWPRSPVATASLTVAADSADTADDSVFETAAENEGMPPRREPPTGRRSARVRRVRAAARS